MPTSPTAVAALCLLWLKVEITLAIYGCISPTSWDGVLRGKLHNAKRIQRAEPLIRLLKIAIGGKLTFVSLTIVKTIRTTIMRQRIAPVMRPQRVTAAKIDALMIWIRICGRSTKELKASRDSRGTMPRALPARRGIASSARCLAISTRMVVNPIFVGLHLALRPA